MQIARLQQEHPRLGRHLEQSVRTGMYCVYSRDAGALAALIGSPVARYRSARPYQARRAVVASE
jgi:hypothetical protein